MEELATNVSFNLLHNMAVLFKPHVYIKNLKEVEIKMKKIIEGGAKLLQIITDFDRTLTKDNVNGIPNKSSHCIFEQCSDIPKHVKDECKRLCDVYRPIEVSPTMSTEEKIPYMIEWWKKSEEQCCGITLSESSIDNAVIAANVEFRDGCSEMFKKLCDKSVPVLVFSAGIGDVITAVLRHRSLNYPNVHVISNFLRFDGLKILGYHGPTIHVFNKNEKTVKNSEYFKEVNHCINVLLMGDSLGDANMAEGVPQHGTVLKIGFLTTNHVDEYLPQYMDKFDIVLLDDQTMDIPLTILDSVLKS
ncbi:cytosolic 5'-nucleotidase IIIB isoform X2 [Lycorma delicatula]